MPQYTPSYLVAPTARLAGGDQVSYGRVEININNRWGPICDHGWTATDTGKSGQENLFPFLHLKLISHAAEHPLSRSNYHRRSHHHH